MCYRSLIVRRKEEIFTERFLPLYPQLFRVAAAMLGDDSEAADAVQEAMIKIWRGGDKMESMKNPEGYAVAVLRNTAIDILRGRKVTIPINEACNLSSSPDDGPDSAEFLLRLIATLPDSQQKVLILSSFNNLTNNEIASVTGFSPGNVRQLLSRGRKKIRELYNRFL